MLTTRNKSAIKTTRRPAPQKWTPNEAATTQSRKTKHSTKPKQRWVTKCSQVSLRKATSTFLKHLKATKQFSSTSSSNTSNPQLLVAPSLPSSKKQKKLTIFTAATTPCLPLPTLATVSQFLANQTHLVRQNASQARKRRSWSETRCWV